jgi:Lamin Tail Domain
MASGWSRGSRFGVIGRGVVAGTVVAVAAAAAFVGLAAGTAHAAGGLIISEVAPWGSGNSSYAADWFEVTNTGGAAIDISGWKVDDNSNLFSMSVSLTGISSIAAGESVIFLESAAPATTIPLFTSAWFGANVPSGLHLGTYSGSGVGLSTGGDAVNLYDAAGALRANVSFGASPATAPFATFDNAAGLDNTAVSTLSVAGVNGAFLVPTPPTQAAIGSPGTIGNGSTPPTTTTIAGTTTTTTTVPSTALPWPGDQSVQNASTFGFGGNLSGLIEESSGGATPSVLWGVRNGPGSLFRLLWDGTNWNPDAANGWSAGKGLLYPNGTGEPDSEGVTFTGSGSAGGIFVSAERNNLANTVSRLSVLRYDPSAVGTSLTASMEWNLTSDLPPVGANLGLEGITWIPDTYLVANGFFDEHAQHNYNPGDYADHGTGLFFVGLEGNGIVYGYALDQVGGGFTRVATISSGFPGVMDVQFDRDLNELWAVCDNTCNGQHALLRINQATGRFGVVFTFDRPTGMPNFNNEGFAIAPAGECAGDRKPVYWADDGEDLGVSIRRGNLPCTAIVAVPPPAVPEFPMTVLASLIAIAFIGAIAVRTRRRSTPAV